MQIDDEEFFAILREARRDREEKLSLQQEIKSLKEELDSLRKELQK